MAIHFFLVLHSLPRKVLATGGFRSCHVSALESPVVVVVTLNLHFQVDLKSRTNVKKFSLIQEPHNQALMASALSVGGLGRVDAGCTLSASRFLTGSLKPIRNCGGPTY